MIFKDILIDTFRDMMQYTENNISECSAVEKDEEVCLLKRRKPKHIQYMFKSDTQRGISTVREYNSGIMMH